MNIPRKLAVLIVFGVPAIIGGGIVYSLSGHSYPLVVLYEILLYAGALTLVVKGVE